jgi:hypothetical protein
VQVEVTDASGEKVIFLLFTRISLDEEWIGPDHEDFREVLPPTTEPVNPDPVNPDPTNN